MVNCPPPPSYSTVGAFNRGQFDVGGIYFNLLFICISELFLMNGKSV